ncbi:MLO-like protein 3 [Argentina anserina]|uniref:MLO-like protein 3 n=1 Tax=Argentina anserina TaxID=57926 RepID=UPI0021762CBD|nr:MLO-like protein 3 [Potentilla anserina]
MASEESRSLLDTPTWALATVCFVFIFLSIFIEHMIHLLSQLFKRHKKTALFEAVEKLKSVLMLLGFMSLILTVTQRWISKICIPTKAAYTMLPCRKSGSTKTTKALGFDRMWSAGTTAAFEVIQRRLEESEETEDSTTSSTTSYEDHCESQGKTSFISQGGLNQLNNFIFVLAVMQIVYSVLTMALGRAKMRRWEAWERETQTVENQVANDPNRFRFTRQTTFARRHMNSCTRTPIQLWIKCFFRQFFHSVERVDYLTLRHGFISTHLSTNNAFNFQAYIQRSLEDDFREVVGISPFMWFIVVIFILVDVHGWEVYLWVSFVPLIIVLVLGTKLEVVVARMAHQLSDQSNVIKGTPLVQPKDSHFWFSRPRFVLTLVHLTLFTNAFEFAFFIWVTVQYGIHSCYHEHIDIIIIRVVLAVVVQVMCSYITLPLYALVTQMGSNFKSTHVLEEQTTKVIKQWHADVKKKRKQNRQDDSESGHDYSSTVGSSRRTMNPPDFSSHHRQPTFADVENGQEIVEEHQEKGGQNEIELASTYTIPSTEIHIEISGVNRSQN